MHFQHRYHRHRPPLWFHFDKLADHLVDIEFAVNRPLGFPTCANCLARPSLTQHDLLLTFHHQQAQLLVTFPRASALLL